MKMNHILCWNYVFLLGFISSICLVSSHNDKKSILPQLVDNIVENEIVRKVPAVKNVVKKAAKRNKLAALGSTTHSSRTITKMLHHTPPIISALLPFVKKTDTTQHGDGSHMKAATDAINKLVDESIAQKLHVRTVKNLRPNILNRVEEAEREVSQMLLKNIEHHIQDAGKIFISPDEKETACRDKLDGCDKLAKAGVCKTSRDAMKINCRHTCNYCQPVTFNTALQSKLLSELVVLKNIKAKIVQHFAAKEEAMGAQVKDNTGASAANGNKLEKTAQAQIVNDLVELEEHIRSQTKVPSEKRSSVESHHDVQGLMNVVERDLKGDNMQDKREKVLHDVWSLTRQLEYLESEPKTQSNLVKRSKVYPKVAATIANKLGQILSQGLLLNSDTQSKVWDELEGVVADISRGVKDVALKNSIDSAKLAVAKNSTSKKDLVQSNSNRNSQLKLMTQLRSLMSVHSRLVSKLFKPNGEKSSKVKENSQDAIKEIVTKAVRENLAKHNIINIIPAESSKISKEISHVKKKFMIVHKQSHGEAKTAKKKANDKKTSISSSSKDVSSIFDKSKSKIRWDEAARAKVKSEIHIKDDDEKIKELSASLDKLEKLEKHFKNVKKFIKADKDHEMEEELEDMITGTEKPRVDKSSAKRFDNIMNDSVISNKLKSTEPSKVKFGQGRYISHHQNHKKSRHNPKIIFIPHRPIRRRYRKKRKGAKKNFHRLAASAAKDEQLEKKLPEAVVPLKSDETLHKEKELFMNQEEEKPKVEYVDPIKTSPNLDDGVSEKDEALAFGDLPMSDPSGTPKLSTDSGAHEEHVDSKKEKHLDTSKLNQNTTDVKDTKAVETSGKDAGVNSVGVNNISESKLPVSKPQGKEDKSTNNGNNTGEEEQKSNKKVKHYSDKTSSNGSVSNKGSSTNSGVYSDSKLSHLPMYTNDRKTKKKVKKRRKHNQNSVSKEEKANVMEKEIPISQNVESKLNSPKVEKEESEPYVKHKEETVEKERTSSQIVENKEEKINAIDRENSSIQNVENKEEEIKPMQKEKQRSQETVEIKEALETKEEEIKPMQKEKSRSQESFENKEEEIKPMQKEKSRSQETIENKEEEIKPMQEEKSRSQETIENKEEEIKPMQKEKSSWQASVKDKEEENKPMQKEKPDVESHADTKNIETQEDRDEDSPEVKVKEEESKTTDNETPSNEENEIESPVVKTDWEEQEPLDDDDSTLIDTSDVAPPPPPTKENIEVINREDNYPIPNVYSDVYNDNVISEPLYEDSAGIVLKQNSDDNSRDKTPSDGSDLQQNDGHEEAAIVVESGVEPDGENEDIDDYFKAEYDSTSSGSSSLDTTMVKSADNSDNKVNKVIAENDKEDSKKLSKQKPDAGDTETPSDDADVDLKSTNVVESIAEPKKEGKGIGSKSKTEDDSNSSGSTPLNNADANSPVANGTNEKFEDNGSSEENPDELSLTNITKEISTQLSDDVGDVQSKPLIEKSKSNEDNTAKDDFESMQSLLLQHQSGKLKDADDANNELVEGIKQHNSVHLDLTHKHGESVQEFGHDRRETLADVENTDDTTVIDEIGEKTHTEHQHSDQGVLDAEGTAATDADDNWDQRICCTKHNQLCCPTPASLVDDDGNEVETKKVVSLDSAAGKYSSGSEVVKEIKNEERVNSEEIVPHGDKGKVANENTDILDESEASDESTHKNTIETGRDHALTKNAILVFEAKNRAVNDLLSISSKTSEQSIKNEDTSLSKEKVDSTAVEDIDSDVILDPDMQAKLSKELESHNDGKDKMLSIKYHEKGRHKKHHRKHHIGSDTVDRLATDEIGMLGEEVTNHDNPSLEREKAPVIFHHREKDKDRDMDEAEKLLATERKLKEAKELEHIKEEANKLLAAHKKVIKQKQREEAAKLLATEKKLKQEEMQIDAKVKQERRKHMHKKKKQTVHRTPAKGKKTSDDEAIPFLNEDPYPLTDFVSEYDKTAETKMTDDENTDNKNKISKKEETVTHNATEKTDQNVSVQPAEEQKSHTSSHSSDINQDIGESPSRIVMKYHDKLHEDDIKNTTESSKINLDDKSDDKHDDVSKKHTTIDMTEHKQEDNTDTVGDAYSKLNNNQEANLGDADIQRHLPMLDEKDVVSENTAEMMNDKEIVEQQQHDDKQTTSNFIENEDKPKQTKNNGDMKDQIQTMLDQAFGEVLST